MLFFSLYYAPILGTLNNSNSFLFSLALYTIWKQILMQVCYVSEVFKDLWDSPHS